MTNVIKKAFTWSVVMTTIAWSMGVAALVPVAVQAETCPTLNAGDLFKVEGNNAVYLLNSDLKRMYFPHANVYKTWYADYSGVQTIGKSCVANYPNATNPAGVNYRPGSKLVKVVISDDVYAVGPNNTRLKIGSEAVAKALYGANWNKLVVDVVDAYWPNLTDGTAVTESKLQNGMLVKKSGETKVYTVDGGKLYAVDGTLASYVAGDVRTVDATVFATAELQTSTKTAASVVSNPSQGAASAGTTTPTAAGELSVSLAADTPAAAYTYKNATRVPFTKVLLTAGAADVTIDSLVLRRTNSPATDAAFSGVNVVLDNGQLLASSYKTLNSDHEATFTEDITVAKNTTATLLIVGKIANVTTYSGEVPKLALASLSTTATVKGTLPIEGNAMTINTTVAVGTLTVDGDSPDVGVQTKEVGTKDFDFINAKMTNGSGTADIQIKSIRFNNAGSASDSDLSNVRLIVDGNSIATTVMGSRYAYFDLSTCGDVCKIKAGKNETFTLRGDITGGSGRTFDFDVKVADDIVAYDLLNNTNVTPSDSINAGNIITISRGKLTVSKSNTIKASNIAESTNDLALGTWNFKVEGEPITVKKIKVTINITDTSGDGIDAEDFTKLKLVDKTGKALTGATDGSGASGDGSVTFSDSFTLPIGDNEIKIVGNLNSHGGATDTVQFGVDFSAASTDNLDATGDQTGDAIALSAIATSNYAHPYGTTIYANLQTIAAVSLAVTTLGQPAAKTLAAGVSKAHYASVRFDAGSSSEDIKVTAFEFYITTSATAKSNELQNIQFEVDGKLLSAVKNGTQTDATDEEISVSLSGTDQFVVKKGTASVMKIYADLSAGATAGGTHKIDITSTNSNVVTSQGVTTGNDVTETYSTAASNNMTVGTAGGTMEVSLDSNTPGAQLMAGGTTVDLAKFKFYVTSTEDVELDYIYLNEVVSDTASSSYTNYDEIWFVDKNGVEIVGTRMTPTNTTPLVDFSDDAFVVNVSETQGEVLTLKAKLAPIGTGFAGATAEYIGMEISEKADVVAKGDSSGSGTTEFLSSSAAPTGKTHLMYKSYPKVSKLSSDNTKLSNGTEDLFKFQVQAVNGDVDLFKFTFDIATTVATLSNLYLYDVTNSSQELTVNETAGTAHLGVLELAGGADWDTNYSAGYITVSANSPRTFVLRGNVAGSTTGASITTGLAGDAAYSVYPGDTKMGTAAELDNAGNIHDDFIWSDASASSHSRTTDDWTNGYLVSGLASTTSVSETISY